MFYYLWKRASREVILFFAFFLPPERKRQLERRLRGREELRRLGLADVVIVSFGKSGRTWLRVLLSRFFQLRFGLRPSAFIGFDNLHRRHEGIPRIFFTHDNYLRDFTGNLDNKRDFYGRKVVLLVRQPEDVAVSQFHQWKFRMRPHKMDLNRYPSQGTQVDVFNFVMDEDAGLPKVIDFMNGWAKELPRLQQLLIVRYEDLRRDTAGELRRVLEFMDQQPTDAGPEGLRRFRQRREHAQARGKAHLLARGLADATRRQEQSGLLQGSPREGGRLSRLFRRAPARGDGQDDGGAPPAGLRLPEQRAGGRSATADCRGQRLAPVAASAAMCYHPFARNERHLGDHRS